MPHTTGEQTEEPQAPVVSTENMTLSWGAEEEAVTLENANRVLQEEQMLEEGEGGMIWENCTETCVSPSMTQIASPGSMHEAGRSGPVHWDDPEGWDGREVGGSWWGHMCTPG